MIKYILALLLVASVVHGAQPPSQPISFPVTITSGTWVSNQFNVPKNQSGVLKVELPCDSAWTIEIYIQTSLDGGKTWNCDITNIKCPGMGRTVAGPCVAPDGQPLKTLVGYIQKGTPLDNAAMRFTTVSNLTKAVTVIITFDPSS